MSVPIIGKIKQQNSGTYKLMDFADVDYDGTGTSAKDVLDGHTSEIAALTLAVGSANADIDGGNFTDTAGTDVISGGDF